jgi:tryptophan halogenase
MNNMNTHGGAIRRIVIVGGGTAGWMTAAPLAQRLARHPEQPCEIILVESPEIGTIGVGEATLPTIASTTRRWAWMPPTLSPRPRPAQARHRIQDWGHLGNRFFHQFGDFGPPLAGISAHHHWLRLAQAFNQMPA